MTDQQIMQLLRLRRDGHRAARKAAPRKTDVWHQLDGGAEALNDVLREIRERRKEERETRG